MHTPHSLRTPVHTHAFTCPHPSGCHAEETRPPFTEPMATLPASHTSFYFRGGRAFLEVWGCHPEAHNGPYTQSMCSWDMTKPQASRAEGTRNVGFSGLPPRPWTSVLLL